jgi:hypothetical protein
MGRNNDDFNAWYKDHMKAVFEKKGWRENALREAERPVPTHAAAVANDYSPMERKMVKIDSIKSSQTHVSPGAVNAYAKDPHGGTLAEPAHLWKNSRGLNVIDGNHRINAAIQRGDSHIMAHIWKEPR